MSGATSPRSPAAVATTPVDEANMPQGHCRYILLLPEIRGQRCACVGFTLNKGIPGATCDCGHLACFHNKEPEASSEQQRSEIDILRRRLQKLEDQLSSGHEDLLESVVSRINSVEDHLDKSRDEFESQIKGAYRNVSISWQSINALERRSTQQEDTIRQLTTKLSTHDEQLSTHIEQLERLHAGQMELRDADIGLEERIENLADMLEDDDEVYPAISTERRQRRRSTSDTSRPNFPLGVGGAVVEGSRRPHPSADPSPYEPARGGTSALDGCVALPIPKPLPASARSTGAWTVHISLLPKALVPMPFERNTNAYQRCLSRGLHQMVAVHGRDAESFERAVEKAFGSFLKGRPWMPLQAKLCDAEQLQGLPMLRQLEPHLIESRYDHEFIRTHSAVCDNRGMIDSMYIAMRHDTISWHTLRNAPVFMEGLEDAWAHDPLLDNDPYPGNMAIDDRQRPAAGDITAFPNIPSLKRPHDEIAQSSSTGSAGSPTVQSDEARAKRTRPTPPSTGTSLVEMRRRIETA